MSTQCTGKTNQSIHPIYYQHQCSTIKKPAYTSISINRIFLFCRVRSGTGSFPIRETCPIVPFVVIVVAVVVIEHPPPPSSFPSSFVRLLWMGDLVFGLMLAFSTKAALPPLAFLAALIALHPPPAICCCQKCSAALESKAYTW